jgi:hypothetical protein
MSHSRGRINHRDGETSLDLAEYVLEADGTEKVIRAQPTVIGPRSDVARALEELIADVFETLSELDVDTTDEVAAVLTNHIGDADVVSL